MRVDHAENSIAEFFPGSLPVSRQSKTIVHHEMHHAPSITSEGVAQHGAVLRRNTSDDPPNRKSRLPVKRER